MCVGARFTLTLLVFFLGFALCVPIVLAQSAGDPLHVWNARDAELGKAGLTPLAASKGAVLMVDVGVSAFGTPQTAVSSCLHRCP